MLLHRTAAAAAVATHLLLLLQSAAGGDHNITAILAKFPEFSTFNDYLTQTRLAAEINRRQTITVCAVDDAGMEDLLTKNYSINVVKNVLSLHVLLDYFDRKKLRNLTGGSDLTATVFQASGEGPGTAGIVNITDLSGGKVIFAPEDNDVVSATFVKSLLEIPYNLSVIQISNTLPPPATLAPPSPTPSPLPPPPPLPSQWNFTAFMSDGICKVFARVLLANTPAQDSFAGSVAGGLTIFCPDDDAMKSFIPKYMDLSGNDKRSLLQYHATPVYLSVKALQSVSSPVKTLATAGDGKYGFTVESSGIDVTIETGIVKAKIVKVVKDEKPLAIYALDKALLPRELSSPAPPVAEAPEDSPPDSQADPPEDGTVDHTNNGNGAVNYNGHNIDAVIFVLCVTILLLV
ncbi:fasciclin-like arabinogalactan protein 1 [Andrographis paniculata]|uniref:fasciclin-like arabinogalactan protein 1 n=1 Tax=Andrographis paniculata TaxID=175694 RepID=UPI0021E71051|nr:fasciclin-like arabinogalactan protein 1 [Andrographis paniculata]